MSSHFDDKEDQENSSHPQPDPYLTEMSNIANAPPEITSLLQSEIIRMQQRQGLDQNNLPDVSNINSGIDQEILSFMRSEGSDMSEITRQRQALDYYNQRKQSLPQDPVGISRIESQSQEDNARNNGCRLLFNASTNEAEDNVHTLKLLVRLRRNGSLSAPEHVNESRFLERWGQLENMYDKFMKKYGNKPLNRQAFCSDIGYLCYKMSRFIWGDDVIATDGSSTSTGFDVFDPYAPFYHPDMKSYPYDPGFDPGVEVDPNGSSEQSHSNEEPKPNDPFCFDVDEQADMVLDQGEACFGSELEPDPAPVMRVSATGKKLVIKGPQPEAVKVKSGRDTELEADTAGLQEGREYIGAADFARAVEISLGKVPEDTKGKRSEDKPAPKVDTLPPKKRKNYTLPDAMNIKQSEGRKLLDSPAKDNENQREEEEEERFLLVYLDDENDDDYNTLDWLFRYTLDTGTYILQRGAFVQNFEKGLTKYINAELRPLNLKITTDQCKKKVMELREKYLKFIELNGGEDLIKADFSVDREFRRFEMFRTVWGAGTGSGESGSGTDTNSGQKKNVDQGSKVEQSKNVGIAVQGGVGNMREFDLNADSGHAADPISAPLTHVSASDKAPQAVNVISGAEREFEDDLARAIANSLREQNVRGDTVMQGTIGDLKDSNMNANSSEGGQENADKMDVDE